MASNSNWLSGRWRELSLSGKGVDVSPYRCVVSPQEAGKITASSVLRYARLPTRRELLIQRVRRYLFLFIRCESSLEAAA